MLQQHKDKSKGGKSTYLNNKINNRELAYKTFIHNIYSTVPKNLMKLLVIVQESAVV